MKPDEDPTKDPTLWLECMCTDSSHAARLVLFPPYGMKMENSCPEPPELFVNLQLNPAYGFWKRLWYALFYVFLKRVPHSHYHWVEMVVRRDQVDELQAFLHQYRMAIDAWADRCAEVITNREKDDAPD